MLYKQLRFILTNVTYASVIYNRVGWEKIVIYPHIQTNKTVTSTQYYGLKIENKCLVKMPVVWSAQFYMEAQQDNINPSFRGVKNRRCGQVCYKYRLFAVVAIASSLIS